MADSILTTQQVADLFAVHPTTVTKWADSGSLPHFRTPGGHRRFREADVVAVRDGGTEAPAGAA
jgi:excisionase family DNA binding protein